jgi:hypothetical protein
MILSLSTLSFVSTLMFYLFPNAAFFIFDLLCVFAPQSGYLDQLRRMLESKCSAKFEPGSSLVLIFSNFLRIVYWYGNRFALYLLWQSVVTLVVHDLLCLSYFQFKEDACGTETPANNTTFVRFWNSKVRNFRDFSIIMAISFAFVIILVVLFGLVIDLSIVMEFVGLVSNVFDSLTTFPPFVSVVIHGDVTFITKFLILQYVAAAFCKSVLYLCRPVPWTFRVGLLIQCTLTGAIAIQYYRIQYRASGDRDNGEYSSEEEEDRVTEH